MYKDKVKQKQAHIEAQARYRLKNKVIGQNGEIGSKNSVQDCAGLKKSSDTLPVIPPKVIPEPDGNQFHKEGCCCLYCRSMRGAKLRVGGYL